MVGKSQHRLSGSCARRRGGVVVPDRVRPDLGRRADDAAFRLSSWQPDSPGSQGPRSGRCRASTSGLSWFLLVAYPTGRVRRPVEWAVIVSAVVVAVIGVTASVTSFVPLVLGAAAVVDAIAGRSSPGPLRRGRRSAAATAVVMIVTMLGTAAALSEGVDLTRCRAGRSLARDRGLGAVACGRSPMGRLGP